MAEMVDEKKTQAAPEAPSARQGDGVRKGFAALTVLAGLCWGLSLGFLLSFSGWLGQPTLMLSPSGKVGASAGGLGVGLAAGAALALLSMKKAGGRLSPLKAGQGKWVRLAAYGTVGVMAVFGAYTLYMAPPASSSWWGDLSAPLVIFGKALALKPILFPSAAVVATVLLVAHLLLNREGWTDFLIETEGEIKKVSWPSRKEYLGSSVVVVLVVALVSTFLYVVDLGLTWLMHKTGIGF
jgi:preprotein translocase SecE subunit